MITQESRRELLPDRIQKKWEKDDEEKRKVGEPLLTYPAMTCLTVETTDDLVEMVGELMANQQRIIGFDAEATSVRPESASLVGMSFSYEDNRGFYVPLAHSFGQNVDLDATLEIIEPVLQSRLSMAGGKYDWHLLKRYGVDVKYGIDSQTMSRLMNEVDYGVGLKPTVARMFGVRMIDFKDVVTPAKLKLGQSFADEEIGLCSLYAAPDAVYTRRVSRYVMENLPEAIRKFLLKIEHEIMRIAGEMEWNGVPLDRDYLERHITAGEAMVQTLYLEAVEGLKAVAVRRGRAASEVPDDLNMNSAKQMQHALFDVCGFTPVRRSKKTGNPSADKASIEKMAERDPEVDWIRRYRSAESRVGDLHEMLDFALEGSDGWWWLHGSLNPTGAATGRWSSSGPNLQNIPKGVSTYESRQSRWEVRPRDAIKAPPGWHIVTADYSQIELRVAAGESQCRMWIDAFRNGDDVHSASAAAIHDVPIEAVTSKQRADGKTYNFALLFGQEVKSTAAALGISVAEATRMQQAFWEGLPEVKSWIDRVHTFVKDHSFVETKFGRRRWLRGIDSDNKWIYLQNLREAVNTVVQGTAADILKIGMTRAEAKWKELGAKLFLVVHDQYVWLVPETTAPDVFCVEMDKLINFKIPGYPEMVSDYSIGHTFDSLVDFERAAVVPSTWEGVFIEREDSSPERESTQLHIEVESIDIEGLTQLTKLVAEHPGSREVVLAVTSLGIEGIEKLMNDLTSLGIEDELLIRAAVGNAARVTLV